MDLTTTKAAKLPPGEFRFITGAVEIEKAAEAFGDSGPGPRRFKMIASSTVIDQAGDEIKMSALQDLAASFQRGQNVFTDHDHKVRNVFGRTDYAQIMASGENDPKTGQPIYDLHVAGVVNTPDPTMVQLADSIDGGFVTFGASIGAVVRDHKRNKAGGMDIYRLDGKEVSLVGIPMNQRSWTYKAAKAAKALDAQTVAEIEDEEEDAEAETIAILANPAAEKSAEDLDQTEAITNAVIRRLTQAAKAIGLRKADGCPTCGMGDDAQNCDDDYHSAKTKSLDPEAVNEILNAPTLAGSDASEDTTNETTADGQGEDGQAADPAATETASPDPETASDDAEKAEADLTPDGEQKTAAFNSSDVAELMTKAVRMAELIMKRDEVIAAQNDEIVTLKAENVRLTSENEAAGAVIERVMQMPLRRKAQDHIGGFVDRYPSNVSDGVKAYLEKTAGDRE